MSCYAENLMTLLILSYESILLKLFVLHLINQTWHIITPISMFHSLFFSALLHNKCMCCVCTS